MFNSVGKGNLIQFYSENNVSFSVNPNVSNIFYSMIGAGIIATLPDPTLTKSGFFATFSNYNATQSTLSCPSGTINDASIYRLNQYDSVTLVSDNANLYRISHAFTYAKTRMLFNTGSTSIVDGQPAFARTNLNSFVTGLNFADNDRAFVAQVIIPDDYVPNTDMTFEFMSTPSTTTAGSFGWTLYFQLLDAGDLIGNPPTAPVVTKTATTTSSAVLLKRMTTSITITAADLGSASIAGRDMFFTLVNTSSPASTNPYVQRVSCKYKAFVDGQ
jgi:hypothetical protein